MEESDVVAVVIISKVEDPLPRVLHHPGDPGVSP